MQSSQLFARCCNRMKSRIGTIGASSTFGTASARVGRSARRRLSVRGHTRLAFRTEDAPADEGILWFLARWYANNQSIDSCLCRRQSRLVHNSHSKGAAIASGIEGLRLVLFCCKFSQIPFAVVCARPCTNSGSAVAGEVATIKHMKNEVLRPAAKNRMYYCQITSGETKVIMSGALLGRAFVFVFCPSDV